MNRRQFIGACFTGMVSLSGCTAERIDVEPTGTPTPTLSPSRPTSTPRVESSPTETPTQTTPPEDTPTQTETPDHPPEAIKLVSLEAPVNAEIGTPVQYRFTVENVGNEIKIFEPTVYSSEGTEEWKLDTDLEAVRLNPGDRHTFSGQKFTREFLQTIVFTIEPLGYQFSTEFVDKQLPFYDQYRDPLNREITCTGISIRKTIEGNSPAEGFHWMLATIRVENRDIRAVDKPEPNQFTLLADSNSYKRRRLRIDGEYESGRLPRRDTSRGWLIYQVPEEIMSRESRLRYVGEFADGSIGVQWYTEPV